MSAAIGAVLVPGKAAMSGIEYGRILMRGMTSFLTFFVVLSSVQAGAAPLKVWLFETHLRGALNQRMAVAKKLTQNIEVLKMPSRESGVTAEQFIQRQLGDRNSDPKAWPDIILHTEDWKHEAEFLMALRSLSPKPLRLVYTEDPKNYREQMDLISMDSRYPIQTAPNIMRTMGVSSQITPELLAKAKEYWKGRLAWMPKPLIMVALGGNALNNDYKPEFATDLGARLKAVVAENGGSVVIVTSRRTPEQAVVSELVKSLVGIPLQVFNWNKENGDEEKFFAGALSWATHVVATGDSMSMLSDTVVAGKPLYIHAPTNSILPEHSRLIEDLYVTGRARPFTGKELKTWTYEPIDVAEEIALEIKRRFTCEGLLK